MTIRRFKDIQAWQAARILVREVYAVTKSGDLARDFSLRDQLRRAAVSTMSNIAEGFSRGSNADFARFLDISRGSVSEVESLLVVCEDVGYLTPEQAAHLEGLAEDSIRLIAGFLDYLRTPKAREGGEGYSP